MKEDGNDKYGRLHGFVWSGQEKSGRNRSKSEIEKKNLRFRGSVIQVFMC